MKPEQIAAEIQLAMYNGLRMAAAHYARAVQHNVAILDSRAYRCEQGLDWLAQAREHLAMVETLLLEAQHLEPSRPMPDAAHLANMAAVDALSKRRFLDREPK
jgi:hypothetical protein